MEEEERESCAIYSPALLDEFIAIRDPGPSIASGVLSLGIRRPAGKVLRRGISMPMGRRGDLDFWTSYLIDDDRSFLALACQRDGYSRYTDS
jgi:hypothetical protein